MSEAAAHPGAEVLPFEGRAPRIAADAFIAPGCAIIGDVAIGAGASIWYNCVLRGDINRIVIGPGTNIQDGSVIHVEGARDGHQGCPTLIGADCLVGHMALIHGAVLEDGAFVGMGAIAMDGARVASGAMLGAGSLLPPGKVVPAGELWVGRPARFVRFLDAGHAQSVREQTRRYVELAARHRQMLARG